MPTRTKSTRKQADQPVQPLHFVVVAPPAGFYRADIEFHGIDHSGPSYEARVFLNNPNATNATELDPAQGYVGSFYVFGHGGCFGDVGHCDIPEGPRRAYDLRPQHQLTPHDARLVATDEVRTVLEQTRGEKVTVTVVPVIEDIEDYTNQDLLKDSVKIENAALLTYA